MNKEKVRELLKKRSTKIGSIVLAAAIVFGGSMWAWQDARKASVPELVTFVDQAEDMVIEEEEPPLGAPKVTRSTKTQTKKKKIKLKKASKKTYVQKGKSSTKKTTKVNKKGSTTTTTETVKATSVKTQFKKGSKVKTQVTTVKTTVTKTVQTQNTAGGTPTATAAAATPVTTANGPANISSLAPRVDSRVMNAFNKLGFTVNINSGVNYSGLFDARTRSITLKKGDATVYHELGHFLGFIAGNYDKTAEFQGIFNREKGQYTAYNKAYVLSNSSEYFAESFKNYTEDPGSLRASRPETFAAIEGALSRVTDSQLNNIMSVYKVIWK